MTDALWYLGRGSGVVSLVLLTIVVALGVAGRSGRALGGLPRFAVARVHRSAGLLAVVFLAVHVLTLLADPYAQLDLLALVVPFTAAAHPFWYGLGALALDLVVALVVTGLLRQRIGPRTWKALHLTAYLAWPVALAHGLGSGSDAGSAWMLAVTGVCVAGVVAAVGWRLSPGFAEAGRAAERRTRPVHPPGHAAGYRPVHPPAGPGGRAAERPARPRDSGTATARTATARTATARIPAARIPAAGSGPHGPAESGAHPPRQRAGSR